MKVFITRIIPEAGLQIMREAGIEYREWREDRDVRPDELVEWCKKHDALISVGQDRIDRSFLEQCRHLKTVAQMAVGYDNIDIETATRLGIPIGNTPGVLSRATADVAFLLMLMVSRKALFMHKRILQGQWGFYEPTANLGIELHSKTLGILGLGKIGLEMARRCHSAFQMRIIYHNRHPRTEAEHALGARMVTFDELLGQSDVLSVHTTLTSETKEYFNITAFARMKRNAIFINTARGGIHVESDLVRALDEAMIWGAGLDVTNPEPMAPDNPLLNMPNVVVLPHIGSATQETRAAMSVLAAQNIVAAALGQPLPHVVNPEVYNR